jgi:hypothetical protein
VFILILTGCCGKNVLPFLTSFMNWAKEGVARNLFIPGRTSGAFVCFFYPGYDDPSTIYPHNADESVSSFENSNALFRQGKH